MGFHLRKTFKAGLFNFNLSNSGIGTSFGVKGFRVGVDGKGRTYVGGGKGMFRFREYIKNDNNSCTSYSNKPKINDKIGCYGCGLLLSIILCTFFPPLILLFLYLLPFIIAELNELPNKMKIYYLNFFLGWTIFGWFATLIMAILGIIKKNKIKELENLLNESNISNLDNILEELITKNPNKSTDYKLEVIAIYKEAGEYQKALDLLESSYLGETRQLKMRLLSALERYQDVIGILQKDFTEEEKKEHPALYAFMAEMFLKLNKPEIAIEALKQVPLNARKMSDELCAFRYALGECYEAIGDIENAKKQYQKIYVFNADFEDVAKKIDIE